MMKDPKRRAILMRWVAGFIAKQDSKPISVAIHSEHIIKASFSLLAKILMGGCSFTHLADTY